jgi:hypothetical protein
MSWWNLGLNAAKLVANVITSLPFAAGESGTSGTGGYRTGGLVWTLGDPAQNDGAAPSASSGIYALNAGDTDMGVSYSASNGQTCRTEYLVVPPGKGFDATDQAALYKDGTVTIAETVDPAVQASGVGGAGLFRAVTFAMRTVPIGAAFIIGAGVEGEYRRRKDGRISFELSLTSKITDAKVVLRTTSTESETVVIEAELRKPADKGAAEGWSHILELPAGFAAPSVVQRAEVQLNLDQAGFAHVAQASAHLMA